MDARAGGSRGTVPISVVIPAFDRADLLEAALASVRAQTVNAAEVIVVDDGSSEPETIARAARSYDARLIRQANAGPSASRNAGLEAATSPWVAFLDSDDAWRPRKIELQWAALEANDRCGAAICDFRIFTDIGSFDETAFELNVPYKRIAKRPLGQNAFELLMPSAGRALARSMFVQPSGLLISREIAMREGGFDTTILRCEDHEFALRVFAATPVLSVQNALVRYRVHPASLSKNEVAMRMAAIEVADRVIARPDRYPPGANEELSEIRPELVRKAAAALIKAGDLTGGRRLLAPAILRRPSPSILGTFVATCFVPRNVSPQCLQWLTELWRRRPWRKRLDWEAASPESVAVFGSTAETLVKR